MKTSFFFMMMLSGSLVYGQSEPTKMIPFSQGVDYSRICSEVDPRGACDASNMISDKQGSVLPRFGSERFIGQAFSTNPFSSLYYYNITTGTTKKTGFIGVTGKYIVQSTGGVAPSWNVISSTLNTVNQRFSFVTIAPNVIMTGEDLTDDILRYNVMTSSLSPLLDIAGNTTDSAKIRAKHLIVSRNYLILGNIRDVKDELTGLTTYYPSRWYYSDLLQPSSITVRNFEDVGIENGGIEGFTTKLGLLEIHQPKNITEATFTDLRPTGGDQVPVPIVDGFGVIASKTLQDTGIYDIGLSYEGIFAWDGGRRSRLEIRQEKDIISKKINPTIKRIVENNTYQKAVGQFYPKENWYVFCYEDPLSFPKGVNNSCMVFDLTIGEWFPIDNLLVASMAIQDGSGDDGSLFYGDAKDGYVHRFNVKTRTDDSRQEFSLDNMDSTRTWVNSTTAPVNVLEGTGAVRLLLSPAVTASSITKVAIFNMGEWHDKTRVTKDDMIEFKVFPSSISNIRDFRIDLLVDDRENTFNENFTSVTFSSSALTAGNTTWTTISVALSSFPIRPEWVSLSTEDVTFADGFTYYGVRFQSTGTGNASLTFDDLRLVGKADNKLAPFWLSPQLNTSGQANLKTYRQLILLLQKARDANLKISVLKDYGETVNTIVLTSDVPKEVGILSLDGIGGVYVLDSKDYSVLRSTVLQNLTENDYLHGVADKKYFYLAERVRHRIVKIDRTSMTVIVSSVGTLGSPTTSYDTVHQMALDGQGDLWLVENGNHRIKELTSDLKLKRVHGELGLGGTNYHSPTGITADDNYVWVGDDGNSRIVQQRQSDLSIVGTINLDMNTIGEMSLANDNENLYVAYNKLDEQRVFFEDVVLEKRDKATNRLLLRKTLRPQNSVTKSTYAILGDMCLVGNNLFITFTDDYGSSGQLGYFTQKLSKDDFSLIRQLNNNGEQFTVIGDGQPYKPDIQTRKESTGAQEAVFIQFKYFSDELEPNFRLISQGVSRIEKDFTE